MAASGIGESSAPGRGGRFERRLVVALAEAAIPASGALPAGGPRTAQRMEAFVSSLSPTVHEAYRAILWALDTSTLLRHGRPFSSLSLERRQRLLRRWERSRSRLQRLLLRAALAPIKQAHFDDPALFEQLGCKHAWPPVRDAEPRWLAQVRDGRRTQQDVELECEVVVVGTGAGGAAAAYQLAANGRAVLMLEEGDYHRRSSFSGRPGRAYRTLYRDRGMGLSFGNVTFPLWAGRAVGGTTVINSGTCYRAPERVLTEWRQRHGLPADFSGEGLRPYYEQVEAMLDVVPADPRHVGAIESIIARGASRLGYRHGRVRRNAPDCDAQGVCCLGCPSGAKRSTDVSFVPAALRRGAQLFTAAHADVVEVVGGRARGVRATLRSGATLRVRAERVVVAAGTLMTPLLLRRSGLCRSSGWLGKNLSVHPASKVIAQFDERVDMSCAIPQGYAIDQFQDDDLMFEGGSVPPDLLTLAIPWTGRRFVELMQHYPFLAIFGFMVRDRSRGQVLPGPAGRPLVIYNLGRRDLRQLQRGMVILCEVFQAAGAKRVLPMIRGHDEVSSRPQLDRLRRGTIRAGDLDIAAFHFLGTCRLGANPARSCLGPDHEAHDVVGLHVTDGSALPSSLGVNPQLTIMATALRAAQIIDQRLG